MNKCRECLHYYVCGDIAAKIVYFVTDGKDCVAFLDKNKNVEVVRCKDCKWFNEIGCAIGIVDDSDKPKENDFCSFAERKTDG